MAAPAPGLTDRRVEITGPPDRRMAVNALNSGARVWMADFEDATAPTWDDVIGGQLVLLDAIERRIDFTSPEGKEYRLGENPATIVVRPRGWHLEERHLDFGGAPVPASLVDFGLYFFHCAQRQINAGHGHVNGGGPSCRPGPRAVPRVSAHPVVLQRGRPQDVVAHAGQVRGVVDEAGGVADDGDAAGVVQEGGEDRVHGAARAGVAARTPREHRPGVMARPSLHPSPEA